MSDIDRDVPHDANVALLAVGLEMFPLSKELKLPVLVGLYPRREFREPFLDSQGVAAANRGVPSSPGVLWMDIFAGHEECVVVEPRTAVFTEALEGGAIGVRGIGKKHLRCATQNSSFEGDDRGVVNGVFGKRWAGEIGRLEYARLLQELKAEQEMISGEGRKALIRGVPVTGGIQG